jgi:hypothetical protein
MNLNKYFLILISLGLFGITACDNDDDEPEIGDSSILMQSQYIPQNLVFVSEAVVPDNGWLVIHPDNNGAPDASTIISDTVELEQGGTYRNFFVALRDNANLTDGMKLWVMLHMDDGEEGVWEFESNSSLDAPYTMNGSPTMDSLTIYSPSVEVSNQQVGDDFTVTIDQVTAAVNGWLVVHDQSENGNPGAILGYTQIPGGETEDVEVELLNTVDYTPGSTLYAMLHVDDQPVSTFNFPNGDDVPEVFGFEEDNVIIESFTIQ